MSASDNKQLLQSIFAELAKGNSRPLVDAMADDFRWTMIGTTSWSRTYEGKQDIIGTLFASLRAVIADRTRTVAHRFIAEGDHVVVEARGDNMTKAGLPYKNHYCFVFRLAGGKLQEVTEYMDTVLAAAVLGEPAVRSLPPPSP